MGKGGQNAAPAVSAPGVWASPYDPTAKDAPQLPTKGQLKAVIPKECFQRSYLWSMFYMLRDFAICGGFAYATSQVLSTDMPSLTEDPAEFALWAFGWSFYAFWMGTFLTGPWVLAHECGHGAFSPSQDFNDFFGFIMHQALLVPYFAWQYTHAKHHRRINHLTDGESHVPSSVEDNGLGKNLERNTFYAAWHEAMGDGAFAAFQIWSHLFLGWPLYLLGLASTGRIAQDGTPLNGRIADHFRPSSPMFPEKLSPKIIASTAGVLATLAGLFYAKVVFGVMPVVCWYWGPYLGVNAWLVLYTWLQHTDVDVPHFTNDNHNFVKGALHTIDRPYNKMDPWGAIDFLHHQIGTTHVAHHFDSTIPHYKAQAATDAIKEKFPEFYLYDPTPITEAVWRVCKGCTAVEKRGDRWIWNNEDLVDKL